MTSQEVEHVLSSWSGDKSSGWRIGSMLYPDKGNKNKEDYSPGNKNKEDYSPS
jgi:hypothetical protein